MTPADLDRLRKKWRCYWQAHHARLAAWEGMREARWQVWLRRPLAMPWSEPPRPMHVPIPADLHLLICGARTRAGTPCKRRDLYRSGRCKLHGGLSTGPTTKEGKARSASNAATKVPIEARRTPWERSDYVKMGGRNEPHESPKKVDLSDSGAWPDSVNCWRDADGV